MKIRIEGMTYNEFMSLAKTKLLSKTLEKFKFTGKKGYPTTKGKKYITKESYNCIVINKPRELAEAIEKCRTK